MQRPNATNGCNDTLRAGKLYKRLVDHDVWKIMLSLTCLWLGALAVKRDTQVWLYNFSTSEVEKVFPCQHFLTFSLPNVLFATAAYNFSTSARQKVLETPHVL